MEIAVPVFLVIVCNVNRMMQLFVHDVLMVIELPLLVIVKHALFQDVPNAQCLWVPASAVNLGMGWMAQVVLFVPPHAYCVMVLTIQCALPALIGTTSMDPLAPYVWINVYSVMMELPVTYAILRIILMELLYVYFAHNIVRRVNIIQVLIPLPAQHVNKITGSVNSNLIFALSYVVIWKHTWLLVTTPEATSTMAVMTFVIFKMVSFVIRMELQPSVLMRIKP